MRHRWKHSQSENDFAGCAALAAFLNIRRGRSAYVPTITNLSTSHRQCSYPALPGRRPPRLAKQASGPMPVNELREASRRAAGAPMHRWWG